MCNCCKRHIWLHTSTHPYKHFINQEKLFIATTTILVQEHLSTACSFRTEKKKLLLRIRNLFSSAKIVKFYCLLL